ncbi:hypothetical protein CC85DRAFT_325094 [Cutaneotrichosporon oleaginosum]|uniref:RecQ-mediated genome instability protein 1 n=1 Tax=Cutaneotrichosporon oleaginosum TaxID=879819 RepID=A0A0J1BE25_9TREE|nr:uncharacterized protein CC85DRAFT_325094 [Cutaneotrichosporon oleaginosum]KLT46314.1 hypothetical protein CC85DRAFT_325094 [Cutaneotrichosporon oleaginosum]TXT10315.1 hypothetical protein COLE_04249 [Cutaneotrichosporon oleaginosum]
MATPTAIRAYLTQRYPDPPPDQTWVNNCYTALLEAGFSADAASVEHQYLCSDLGASTTPSLALPTPEDVERHTTTISGPLMVQIHSMMDIGVSAVNLQRTMEERREMLSGATRIRRMDSDEEVEDGKVPAYQRSMLSLEVSDGRTAIRAIEYRRIEGLSLADTPLGTKLMLRNVRCLRGKLHLTPDNCKILGGEIEAFQVEGPEKFAAALEARIENARNYTPAAAPRPVRPRRTLPVRTARSATVAAPRPPRAAPPRRAATDGAAARRAALADPQSDASIEDDSFDIDEAFLRDIEAVEAAAQSQQRSQQRSQPPRHSQRRPQHDVEIIEISDSD